MENTLSKTALMYGYALILTTIFTVASPVAAQFFGGSTYQGGGVLQGVSTAAPVQGAGQGDLKQAIANILNRTLTFTALIGVVMIVIAGFYLIFSFGDDSKRDTARKIIIYVAIGIIIVLLAKVLVSFFIGLPFGA